MVIMVVCNFVKVVKGFYKLINYLKLYCVCVDFSFVLKSFE